jgi:hypothetical protein
MTSEQAFFVFATFVDFSTAFWIMGALFTDRLQKLPRWHLIGLSMGALGLAFQGIRNIQFLYTGVSPSDSELPVWFLKDMGYALIAFHSLWLIFEGRLHLNNRPSEQGAKPLKAKPKTPIRRASRKK